MDICNKIISKRAEQDVSTLRKQKEANDTPKKNKATNKISNPTEILKEE